MSTYTPSTTEKVTNLIVRGITITLCKIDARQLARVPAQGPLIIVSNHINFLEAPIIYTRLTPRPVTGFSKIETWDSAFLGWLFDVWGIIPIRRGEPVKSALKRGLQALKEGYIFVIAPEGTRSSNGQLLRGHPGVVMMALLSKAPLLPIAHYGHENYKECFRQIRRTEIHVAVGQPFKLTTSGEKTNSAVRQRMTDEIMYQLAALLPPTHRGVYADLSKATENYLVFTHPASSNLPLHAKKQNTEL